MVREMYVCVGMYMSVYDWIYVCIYLYVFVSMYEVVKVCVCCFSGIEYICKIFDLYLI